MADMLELEQRLDAYLDVVREHPELSVAERQDLFAIALFPEPADEDWEHLMQCRDPFCQACAGTGEVAA